MAKRSRKAKAKPDEPIVNEFAAQHGDYGTAVVVDLDGSLGGKKQSIFRVLRNMYPSVVDRWFAEAKLNGNVAFQEPQKRALEHVRGLWGLIGERRLVANYTGVGGGSGDGEAASLARLQLDKYQKCLPQPYWQAFENVVRFDMPTGRAGSHLADSAAQQQAHAKAATGFCLSMIAQWRGY